MYEYTIRIKTTYGLAEVKITAQSYGIAEAMAKAQYGQNNVLGMLSSRATNEAWK